MLRKGKYGLQVLKDVNGSGFSVKDQGISPPPGPRQIPTSPALRW